MHVAIIGGAGTIGTTVAYTLATAQQDIDITLVDPATDPARGHAIDLSHGRTASQLPGLATERLPEGHIRARPSGPDALADVDCAIVTASISPPDGTAERGARIRYLEKNRDLADSIADSLSAHDPIPVVVASNPVDLITHRIWESTGWDRHNFVGYSLSETARAADELARIFDCRPNDVYCPTLGEHGEYVVPVFSRLSIVGERVEISEAQKEQVLEYVRNVPYEVIEYRGEQDSSRWVTGQGVGRLVLTLIGGGSSEPLGLSVPLEGEYGCEDVCLSVPVRLGESGWEEIVEWEIADEEFERLQQAAASVASDL
ncbi:MULTISPECIES: malate dehydrogenase [Salinibaculum]|uniref:malate dehydrogenase n=1 Tax=Salinibaculum TaxID=2732368 RepID=UPI0030CEA5E7